MSIFKKYERKKHVNLTVIDVDPNAIEFLKILYDENRVPTNFTVKFICDDFMNYKCERVNLIIGNPPFSKINGIYRNSLLTKNENKESTNLAEFILEKAIMSSDYVSMIMPKNILNTPEFSDTRSWLKNFKIDNIIDFGENGFKGVLVETVNFMIDSINESKYTKIISTTTGNSIVQKSQYIFDSDLPYWIIYRNDFFDKVYRKMKFGVFNVFRDRQITNNNSSLKKTEKYTVRVLKSRNILDSGDVVEIEGYDSYIDKNTLSDLTVNKYFNDDNVYLTPNMTYKPRLIKKEKGYVVNGSIAVLIPKNENLRFSQAQLNYIASEEFRKFYKIARNCQTRSLNVDKISCYWFGINEEI